MGNDSYEREVVNNQKRIIRELKRIADALEAINERRKTPKKLSDYISCGESVEVDIADAD